MLTSSSICSCNARCNDNNNNVDSSERGPAAARTHSSTSSNCSVTSDASSQPVCICTLKTCPVTQHTCTVDVESDYFRHYILITNLYENAISPIQIGDAVNYAKTPSFVYSAFTLGRKSLNVSSDLSAHIHSESTITPTVVCLYVETNQEFSNQIP